MHLNSFVFHFKLFFIHLRLFSFYQYLYRQRQYPSAIKKLEVFTSASAPKITNAIPHSSPHSSEKLEQTKERVPPVEENSLPTGLPSVGFGKIRGRKTKAVPLQTTW